MPTRDQQIAAFLKGAGLVGAERRVLAADASFRRYDRISANDTTVVLMDAPPPKEDVRPFHRIQNLLLSMGFSAPRPLEVDEEAGLLLLEDLGDRTFTRALHEGEDEARLYLMAVDLLIELHRKWASEAPLGADAVPPYDDERLATEVLLLPDWYLPAIGGAPLAQDRKAAYREIWGKLYGRARGVPETLVLRDYHVDNLMVLEGRQGISACGLLDFQDAVRGPVTYDLVSLLEDARRDVAPTLAEAMITRYLDAFPDLDREAFAASYAIMGAQRNAKIIGIFTRLSRRDGKAAYLQHIPRVWRLLEQDLRHPALAEAAAWFDDVIPPPQRIVPAHRPPDEEKE